MDETENCSTSIHGGKRRDYEKFATVASNMFEHADSTRDMFSVFQQLQTIQFKSLACMLSRVVLKVMDQSVRLLAYMFLPGHGYEVYEK